MPLIDGKPFTQYEYLNVKQELYIQGVPAGGGGSLPTPPTDSVYGFQGAIPRNLSNVGRERCFNYVTGTTAADPGTGNVAFNNADPNLATEMYISALTNNGLAFGELLKRTQAQDTCAINSFINQFDAIFFRLTAVAVDNGAWFTVNISVLSFGGTFDANEVLSFDYYPQGNRPVNISCTTVLNEGDKTTQGPTALDTVHPVTFGPGFGTGSDPVMVDAAGLITVNQAGCYAGVFYFQVGRSGASGTSHVWIRFLINGSQQGTPQRIELNGADDDTPVSISFERDLAATTAIEVQMMRDSAGSNSGDLVSATATTLPWGSTDSASVTIVKIKAS